ncbi:HD domain-containing phosphohydrolase [Arcobacter sp. FWKO B]|uniref:HD domain-containing phosphohydrolase n=1 Tax=Arcobacter sp. FWKO B TaxID=2593672 RepID=UPI0018A3F3F3|nr:HD domain-containing phosphohydrolase [Arcobacter sp. FWKO B]QOG12276.1 PAS domain S-box protein [Arcobacter sp. FWKO B]
MNSQLKKREISILYVEDEDIIREEVHKILSMLCEKVDVAIDGKDGLEKFKSGQYDLIITDINMPYMSGFEMLKEIKNIDPIIPAIIISAYSQEEYFLQASKLDIVNDYLFKPLKIVDLMDKINKHVQKIEEKREYKKTFKLLEQYKIAVDESSILSKTDTKGNITYVNDTFCQISKYTRDELIGKPHNIVRHPDMTKEVFKELWKTIKEDKKIWQGKIKNLAKDGSIYIVNTTVVPILDTFGNIEEFIALRYDITELETYKELLEIKLNTTDLNLRNKMHLVKEYETALDVSTSLIRVDLNYNITYVNERFLTDSGYKKEQILNKNFFDIIKSDIKDEIKKHFQTVATFGQWIGVIEGIKNNGSIFYMDFTFKAIKDINDQISEFMGIGKDITEIIELHKEIEDTQKDVIFSLGSIGEARSKETGNHVKRVAEYSKLLALLYGLSEVEAELLKIASPMHDIGKIGIPDVILNKPAKFTPEEFEIMKNHSTIGYNMLNGSDRKLLKISAIIAYEHHEKYDGSGYPRGLKGEDIHLYGRITAIADVFDALGSDRCYKKAWELDRILNLLKEEKGRHFDPILIDLFFENLNKFLAIRDTYKDEFENEKIVG